LVADQILTEVVGDFGALVSVNADGSISPEHSVEESLTLTRGPYRTSFVILENTSADC
jgi:hypothetical protein